VIPLGKDTPPDFLVKVDILGRTHSRVEYNNDLEGIAVLYGLAVPEQLVGRNVRIKYRNGYVRGIGPSI
jgi:hypothetical protein